MIFFLFAQNTDCGYQDGSNECPQSMFWINNKKNIYPNFTFIKVGFMGVYFTWTYFQDGFIGLYIYISDAKY